MNTKDNMRMKHNQSFLDLVKDALSREIKEELNITINICKKIAEEKYKDHKINIALHYFLCMHKSGNMKLIEHENFAWIDKKDFKKYNFVKGDENILFLL